MSNISVKFLIDKEEKRVVFAEAGSDFIDVLFSFLALPLGSIVRLLDKQSGLGSLDTLYESIEQLDVEHLQTEACKEMLLNPRSAAAIICEDLKIKNIHESNPRIIYYCSERKCLRKSAILYCTNVKGCRCSRCGNLITTRKSFSFKKKSDGRGIFVNETAEFLITDNLRVIPTSLMAGCSFLKEMGIEDASILEERVIDFGTKEALNLLRRLFVSNIPLTEVCFPDACMQANVNCSLAIKKEMDDNKEEGEITLKLVLNKKSNNVLYAEVGKDFVNELLSFLTIPLGSLLKLNVSSLGECINNLYSSVENMGLDYFKSENCKNMLLSPKLATFYGFEKQLLNLEEIPSQNLTGGTQFIQQNPKSRELKTDIGDFFVVGSRKFMVADNLHISSLSFTSAINNDMNIPISDLVEKDAFLDKAKAIMLLSTMLISKTVFTDVFCPKLKQCKRRQFL